jgi:nucleoside-diphosphate-sugar epimerase
MTQTILGANGAIGIELAKELLKYTTDIKSVSRNPQKVNPTDILLSADLTKKENIFKAVEGSSIVYVTIGFPYKTKVWKQNWLPFIQAVIDACLKYNAKLVFFDTVYAIGGDHVKHITEESPISPISKKGKIRADVDRLIIKNSKDNGLQAIIARSPDFFGGTARANSIMINLVYDKFIRGKSAQWLCNADKIHSYGYVPELAKGMAMLGNTEDAYNQIWNLPTHPQKIKGKEWITLFAKEMNCTPKYSVLPNWLLKVIGLLVPVMSELVEMNYQYDRDYYFDSSKFNEYFKYQPVSNQVAIKQTVAHLSAL